MLTKIAFRGSSCFDAEMQIRSVDAKNKSPKKHNHKHTNCQISRKAKPTGTFVWVMRMVTKIVIKLFSGVQVFLLQRCNDCARGQACFCNSLIGAGCSLWLGSEYEPGLGRHLCVSHGRTWSHMVRRTSCRKAAGVQSAAPFKGESILKRRTAQTKVPLVLNCEVSPRPP